MTCIVGIKDKENDCVWMGADSLGSDGFIKTTLHQPKVFRNNVMENVVMGSCGCVRHMDILKYNENLFDKLDYFEKTDIDHKYMVNKFIPNVIKAFKEGIAHKEDGKKGANFLIAAGRKLFEVQNDYSVLEHEKGYCAIGSGEYAAEASLFTTENMGIEPNKRIELALMAAEFCTCSVARPFKIINTKNNEEIFIE